MKNTLRNVFFIVLMSSMLSSCDFGGISLNVKLYEVIERNDSLVNRAEKQRGFLLKLVRQTSKDSIEVDKAYSIIESGDSIRVLIELLQGELLAQSGGLAKDGKYIGENDLKVGKAVMISSGNDFKLSEKLNLYVQDMLNQSPYMSDSLKGQLQRLIPNIEVKTWSKTTFDKTPMLAVMAYLTDLQARVVRTNLDVLMESFPELVEEYRVTEI